MRGSVSVFEVVLRGPDGAACPPGVARRSRVLAPAGATEVVLERVSPGPVGPSWRERRPVRTACSAFLGARPEPRRYRVRAGSASSPVVRVRVAPRVAVARRGAAFAVSPLPPSRGQPGRSSSVYDRETVRRSSPVARGRLDASSRSVVRVCAAEGRAHVRAVVRRTARAGATASAARCSSGRASLSACPSSLGVASWRGPV